MNRIRVRQVVVYGMTFQLQHGTALAEEYTSRRFGLKIETFRPGTTNAQTGRNMNSGMLSRLETR
jgi:hypothetical protein